MIEIRKAKSYEMLQGCNICGTRTEMVTAIIELGTERTTTLTRMCNRCFAEFKEKVEAARLVR